ncbi:MAG: PDGLE domain-containing protein [Methanobacterium paludis]|nr:PDGLE domain-containing protein [Methanobacterium paludis]
MSPNDKKLIMVGVVVCFIIAIMAPFIASSNPDGLEKSAEQISTTDESGVYQAPFADYLIPVLGEGPFSGIVALVIGVLIALGLGYGVAAILKRRKPPETSG